MDIVHHDYDRSYSCEESGCDSICRCAVVTDVTVDQSLDGCYRLFCELDTFKEYGLEPALNFWFIRRFFPGETFDFEASGDYYGETLDRIYPCGSLTEKGEDFVALSVVDKIKFMLTKEYGKVLPEVEKVQEWEMRPVFISEVMQTPNNNVNTVQVDAYKAICQSYVNDKRTRDDFQKNVQFLAPLCLKRGKHYQVIDGTHRTIALTSPYKINDHKPKNKKKPEEDFLPLFMWIICPKESK